MHHPSPPDRFSVCTVLSKCEPTLSTLPTENNLDFYQGSSPPRASLVHCHKYTNIYKHRDSTHTLSAKGSLVAKAWIHEFLITQSVGWSIIQFYLWASMSGSNLTCTSFGFFFFFNKVSVVSLSCALSVWLCLTLCVLMSWLQLMLRQCFENTFFLFPLSPVPVCKCKKPWPLWIVVFIISPVYIPLVCLWPQLHVHVEVFIYISKSCCVNVCV